MTSPSQPSTDTALAWLRSDRSAPPGFLPAVQAAEILAAWVRGGADLEAVEARCLAGDSSAARALATVQATSLALARSESSAGSASPAGRSAPARSTPVRSSAGRPLRERLMRTATAALEARSGAAVDTSSMELPPVVAVARRHLARPEEPARDAAIDRLGADVRTGDGVLEQLLDRVATLVDFPLLVVSVVHGGETVHRALRCRVPSPDGKGYLAAPRVVPREASFCTHCVADGSPLVIHDAAADPFFHRHPAVAAFGLVSYCGVPLQVQVSPGDPPAIVGTVCGYDVRPRQLAIEDVALLEIFARRIVSVLEGPGAHPDQADPGQVDGRSTAAAGVDVLAAPMFHDLLEVELLRASGGRPTALLVGSALDLVPATVALGDRPLDRAVLGGHLLAGRLPDGRAAWLLASSAAPRAGDIAAALTAQTGAPVGHAVVASAEDARCSVARWIERASPTS